MDIKFLITVEVIRVVVLNVKVKRFVQARVNGGSNYDSLKDSRNVTVKRFL